jgi:type IV fimbrial biogenesis protein FimT
MELMVTVAVLAIVLGIGAPAFSGLMTRMRTIATMHLLTGALAQARLESIRRNAPIGVCPSGDGTRCAGSVVWDGGWIVFVDAARTGQPQSAADVIQTFDRPGGDLRLRATAGRRLVRFSPNGWSAGSNVTLRLCEGSASGSILGTVIVNNAGRVRSERPTDRMPCPYSG